jgi:putative intracellular protease/amidase
MKGTAAAYTPDSYVVAEDKKTTTHVDMLIDEIDPLKWDGIFLIGGPGALQHCNIPSVRQLISDAHNFDKPIGAIGQATRILAESGALNNKEATGWNDDGNLGAIYAQHGAQNLHESVITDGNLITATGETAATQFARAIITLINSE